MQDALRLELRNPAFDARFVAGRAVVGPKKDNYEALKEICERHCVRRLDLHNSSLTGEDVPDRKSELNILVEFLPISDTEAFEIYPALEQALVGLFGRPICLVRTDALKPGLLYSQVTRRRTLLYPAEGQDES